MNARWLFHGCSFALGGAIVFFKWPGAWPVAAFLSAVGAVFLVSSIVKGKDTHEKL